MPPKKGKKSGVLPHIDRSRALPVRTGIGFWKVLALGSAVGLVVYACGNHQSEPVTPEPAQVVTTQ